jgi:enamine deaminase RidA (YjgF/YER057c/UK114 family)
MAQQRHRDGSHFEQVAAYSRAARAGRRIVVSGTAALDENGRALHPGDLDAQTRAALEIAIAAVEALGGSKDDVVLTRMYLAPGVDWRGCVEAHREMFAGIDPANTTLYAGGLIPEDVLIEVELEAEVTD